MKTIELFCASPASTAICTSMDQRATVRRGTRPMDSRHPRFGEKPRIRTPIIPCTSQQHIDPKPYSIYQKARKGSSAKLQSAEGQEEEVRRKSSADVNDLYSPPGSSRYLLSDRPFFDLLSDSDQNNPGDDHVSSALVVSQGPSKRTSITSNESPVLRKFSSTRSCSNDSPVLIKSSSTRSRSMESPVLKSSLSRPRHQVVELRVSIHCKGCEGKVRKHISRMEGVTSFSIDLESKKVTVIGDVTPLSVLSSISKVKNAQFWPSPTSPSSSPSPLLALRY